MDYIGESNSDELIKKFIMKDKLWNFEFHRVNIV